MNLYVSRPACKQIGPSERNMIGGRKEQTTTQEDQK
jgi:hypothetical protein